MNTFLLLLQLNEGDNTVTRTHTVDTFVSDPSPIVIPTLQSPHFFDYFTDIGVNRNLWSNVFGNLDTEDGILTLTNPSNYTGYNGIGSAYRYNFTGKFAKAEIVAAGNQSLTSWGLVPIQIETNSNGAENAIAVQVSGGNLQAFYNNSFSFNLVDQITYNASIHKFVRIRESSGTIFYDWSTDNDSWTNFASVTNPHTVTDCRISIVAGTWQNETATSGQIAMFETDLLQGIEWSGYRWNKRLAEGAPHYNGNWSADNVIGPDGNGHLLLKITNPTDNSPIAAEIVSNSTGWGYGVYYCVTEVDMSALPKSAVFGGMFTFDSGALPTNNEIDANEASAWGGGPSQTWPVVLNHTYWIPDGSNRTSVEAGNVTAPSVAIHTHRMIWEEGKITWDSWEGIGTNGTLINHSEATDDIPVPRAERVHFNVWVFDGNDGNPDTVPETEVVLRQFAYEEESFETNTASHSIDTLVSEGTAEETETHTVDTLARAEQTITHSVDILVRSESTATHTVDTLTRLEQTTTHTTDMLVRVALTNTHTVDTLTRAEQTATHTVDTLARAETTSTHTLDTLVLAEQEASHTIDTLVSEPETGCFLLKEDGDFILQENGDKILLESCPGDEVVETHTVDTFVRTEATQTHTVDTLARGEQTSTHTVDTLTRAEATNTHTIDTLVRASVTNTHTADTLVRAAVTSTHTVDNLVRITATQTHTTDNLVRATETATHSIDTVVSVPGDELYQHTVDTNVRAVQDNTHTVDTNVYQTATATHSVDNLIRASVVTDHTIDVLVRDDTGAGNIKYWDGSAWQIKQLKHWDGTAWVDAPLKRWNGVDWELITY